MQAPLSASGMETAAAQTAQDAPPGTLSNGPEGGAVPLSPADAATSMTQGIPLPFIAAAAAAVLLPILYRIGIGTTVVVLLLAVSINAVPEVRHIVDSFLGKTPAGRHRLHGDGLLQTFTRQSPSRADTESAAYELDRFVELDVGSELQDPIAHLVDLIQRDFIDFWYSSAVALSPSTPFPKHTRSLLNITLNNLVARVKRQDPKEVSIYLFHSASNALITQVREERQHRGTRGEDQPLEEAREKEGLIRKVRQTSEELLLTLVPRSASTSPLVLSLLTEVLGLQIWSTIQSLNSDYINSTIVSSFGEAVTLAKEVQRKAKQQESRESAAAVPVMQVEPSSMDMRRAASQELAPISQPSADIASTPHVPPVLPPRKAPAVTVVPSLPPRKPEQDVSSGAAPSQPVAPHSIALDSSDHTFAAASFGFVPSLPPEQLFSTRKSTDGSRPQPAHTREGSVTSPPGSVPVSPSSSRQTRLEDKTLEEAIDQGAAKLKAFGKGLFSASQKWLDAALPPDEHKSSPGYVSDIAEIGQQGRRKSIGGSSVSSASRPQGAAPQSPRAPSLKGKERAFDLDEGDLADDGRSGRSSGPPSPTASLRSPSIASMNRSAGNSSASRPGSTMVTSPPNSRPPSMMMFSTSANAPSAAAPAPALSSQARIQRVLDALQQGSAEEDKRHLLIKQLERSLFSKDLSLLFPAPQDDQLRAVLARHSAAGDVVDPSLTDLSDDFHEYLELDTSGTGEKLLRLWTQLDHFGYMVEMTRPTEAQLKEDALGLARKAIGQMDELESLTSADAGPDHQSYITACEMTILRLEQNPNREIFDPLMGWLLSRIQEKYWDGFMRERAGKAGGHASLDIMQRPLVERVPSASTSRRTLESIPGHVSMLGGSDGDLGMSMHDSEEVPARSPESRAVAALPETTASTADEDDNSLAPPSFSVTLTDLSAPSAYHNNHVKNRKELEFLIAVEVENSPGYILARQYVEFEKMDQGIKKALPQSGTKAFPRAPLPSTNFQTSENLCHSLEQYLEALLRDDRYATSEPVLIFFAKERTDSKGRAVALQPLAFLGRGVNNLGKGVTGVTRGIGKTGEFAGKSLATGFGQFTSAVTTFPGMKRSTSGLQSEDGTTFSPSTTGANTKRFSTGAAPTAPPYEGDAASIKSPSTVSLREGSIAEEAEMASEKPSYPPVPETVSVPATAEAPALPPRPASPQGYDVPAVPHSKEEATATVGLMREGSMQAASPVVQEQPERPSGLNYTPRKKPPTPAKSNPTSPRQASSGLPEIVPPVPPPMPRSPILSSRMSFDELLRKDQEMLKKQAAELDSSPAGLQPPVTGANSLGKADKTASEPGTRATSPVPPRAVLSPNEFNNVLSFAMAILEEAYELTDSTWNIKRGILKMLETLLRTSYASVIKAAVTKLVTMASEESFYASNLTKLRESFWPPPENVWWSSLPGSAVPERTLAEKEATRIEARRLLVLQAPEGLKVTLGSAATAEAFGRLHDALQGPGAERLVSSLMLDYLRLLLL